MQTKEEQRNVIRMKFKEGEERKSEGRAGGGREEERTRRKGDEERRMRQGKDLIYPASRKTRSCMTALISS